MSNNESSEPSTPPPAPSREPTMPLIIVTEEKSAQPPTETRDGR